MKTEIQGINILNLMHHVMTAAAESYEYKWDSKSPEFAAKNTSRAYERVQEEVKNINFTLLTDQEKEMLGFQKYDGKYFIPLWLLNALPSGTKVESIMGETLTVGLDNIDNDHRGGGTAFSLV